ncbi:hypothetical protein [uncultured Aquimarina sp.]|uniref:hypothetical protein n=1 Tax=uncultured Aquimarina sp. TaxID=575652 RepID=UPI002625FDFF|nr:hypothetical protein [uncultured Aquimarina sp.]
MELEYDKILELTDEAFAIINSAAEKIEKTTIPIYYHKFQGSLSVKPEQVATGVLLSTEKNNYLITAAHTFVGYPKEDICILNSSIKIPIVGKKFYYNPKDNEINDLIDIAVIKLERFIVDILNKAEKFEFLNYQMIQANHNLIFSKSYFTLGFPYNKEKVSKSDYAFTPMRYLLYSHPVKLSSYNQPKVDKRFNILMSHNRRKFRGYGNKGRSFAPKTEGMSGSGLWFVPRFNLEEPTQQNAFLVGILIELKVKTNSIMYTRIDFVTDILKKHFNEKLN